MTDDDRNAAEEHPIARASLYERMSAISRGERPSSIEAARAHLGTDELQGERLVSLADSGMAEQPARGSVEDAMMAGADLETGELPARETVIGVPRDVAAELAAEGLAQEPIASPPPPERQTFSSAPPPPAQPAAKQEVIEPERAADGGVVPFAARDAGALINMLENGQLSQDVIAAMTALTQGMREIAEGTGKKQKGTLTIKIKLSTDESGEAFFVNGEYSVLAPKVERRKTLLWQDERGHLSPSQPRQRVFFGVKDAGGGPRQIRDATADRRSL